MARTIEITDEVARMRSRNLLHTKHLAEFEQFCAAAGWEKQSSRGTYEVLRMHKEDVKHLLIVHKRSSHWNPQLNDGDGGFQEPMHLTTWGMSGMMAKRFYQSRRLAERSA